MDVRQISKQNWIRPNCWSHAGSDNLHSSLCFIRCFGYWATKKQLTSTSHISAHCGSAGVGSAEVQLRTSPFHFDALHKS